MYDLVYITILSNNFNGVNIFLKSEEKKRFRSMLSYHLSVSADKTTLLTHGGEKIIADIAAC